MRCYIKFFIMTFSIIPYLIIIFCSSLSQLLGPDESTESPLLPYLWFVLNNKHHNFFFIFFFAYYCELMYLSLYFRFLSLFFFFINPSNVGHYRFAFHWLAMSHSKWFSHTSISFLYLYIFF